MTNDDASSLSLACVITALVSEVPTVCRSVLMLFKLNKLFYLFSSSSGVRSFRRWLSAWAVYIILIKVNSRWLVVVVHVVVLW